MPHVVEVNDPGELEHYFLAWNQLLDETPGASFFQTMQWLRQQQEHFPGQARLRVLIVYSAGRPIGIVPLVVVRESTRLGPIRTLTFPLDEWGSFYGPLGASQAATWYAAAHHLRTTPRDWDLLDLRWLDRAGLDRGRAANGLEMAGMKCTESVWREVALVEMQDDWETYWASRTSKMRNNVRRCRKRTAASGNVELVRYRPGGAGQGDDDPRWDLYDECLSVAERSWQGASTDGTTISHAEIRPFLRDCHAEAVRSGMLDLNLLRVGSRPVAFAYNYYDRGHVFGVRAGYDASMRSAGVGNVLYCEMIKDSFARGDTRLDMGAGSLDIERGWANRIATSHRCTHYPLPAPRVQLLRLTHWLRQRRIKATPVSSASAP